MALTEAVLDSLEDLSYPDITTLPDDVSNIDTQLFSKIVAWFSEEFQRTLELDVMVNPVVDDEMKAFNIELNSLLRELESPFNSKNSRLDILHFLCGELFAARTLALKNKNAKKLDIEIDESDTAKDLKNVLFR